MVQSVKLRLGSGHDLMVGEFEPADGLCLTAQSQEPALDSVFPSLPLPCLHSVSPVRNKTVFKKNVKELFSSRGFVISCFLHEAPLFLSP